MIASTQRYSLMAVHDSSHFFKDSMMFDRWSYWAKPGEWRVSSCDADISKWTGFMEAFAVVDDFGNLVKIR